MEKIGRRRHQAVLEEPEAVPDLVRDPQPVVPDLVGLPEQCHLLGDLLLRVPLLGRGEARVVQEAQLLRDANVREQHGSARRLGRMRGQDEANRGAVRAPEVDPVELRERIVERLARHAFAACVLASPPQPVVLLREVRELEVEAERTEDERLCLRLRYRRAPPAGACSTSLLQKSSRGHAARAADASGMTTARPTMCPCLKSSYACFTALSG